MPEMSRDFNTVRQITFTRSFILLIFKQIDTTTFSHSLKRKNNITSISGENGNHLSPTNKRQELEFLEIRKWS